MKAYDNGGKVKQKTSKPSRSNPNLAGRPTTPEESLKRHIEKRKATIQRMSKTERDQLRYENGGKVKETEQERIRRRLLEITTPTGPGRSDYINQEKAAQGPLKKLKSKDPGDFFGTIATSKTKPGTIKKKKAVISVPPAKRRKRRRNRK